MSTPSVAPAAEETAEKTRLTWEDVRDRLENLAALLENLAEPSTRGLTDDLYVAPGTLHYLADTARELAERCEANADGPRTSGGPV